MKAFWYIHPEKVVDLDHKVALFLRFLGNSHTDFHNAYTKSERQSCGKSEWPVCRDYKWETHVEPSKKLNEHKSQLNHQNFHNSKHITSVSVKLSESIYLTKSTST